MFFNFIFERSKGRIHTGIETNPHRNTSGTMPADTRRENSGDMQTREQKRELETTHDLLRPHFSCVLSSKSKQLSGLLYYYYYLTIFLFNYYIFIIIFNY